MFRYIFSVPFWASSLSIYISLYLQCPIWGKFPIYLHSIRSSVSHYVHVPYLFTFHYIFVCKFPNFLCFVISSVSHSGQVPYSFTFHYIFSVPLCASSPYFYISFYIQCPILCKFPNFLCFVISSVSHSGQVPNNFVLHYIFSVPLCASSLSFYLSLFPLCTIMCKFSFFLPFIICSVSHYVQVLHLFTFHYIFSVPFWASSLSIYHLSFSVPFGQVPYLFTFHQIFSVPFGASSLSIYIPLDLQCPIMCKFSIFLHSIISSVSHFGQVPYLFTFHYIFSVPFWASSLSIYISLYLQCRILGKFPIFYISLYLQCPIMCKFTIFLRFIIYLVSHYVQVPYIFMFHYIFSVPFCASSLTSYVSLYLQCPILGKYPIILCFIIYLVSHYVQVPYLFTFHYFLCVPSCASSPSFYLSLYVQCPIMCKFSIFLHSIISLVSHFGQVPYLFTFHYIFQCPILGKFPIYLHSIRSLVSHLGQVPYLFTFHQIFSVPLCASSPSFYIPLYLQCPILGKFPIYLHSIRSSVPSVPFSVPLCASSLSIYISLDLQCPIMCKFSIFFPFHYIFSVPFWASSLSIYIPLDLSVPFGQVPYYLSLYQCPILGKFPIYLHFIISSVSHYVQVLLRFIIFQCPISPYYVSLYLVSHFVQVP